ncbi:arginine--tRNA ligase, cytoplasmic-like [Varroa destructor]|uniref:Probable arginine--tRNA ligase, cytoplasmic n=1 Tax=Varroa destructor TaxID=109461 RepID=A0A7M7IWK6_VARDE|nr:arginine--tRNA ligase, cytoplasmic-like [Varroa destructor]
MATTSESEFCSMLQKKERELQELTNEVEALSRGELLVSVPEEVEKLRTQNAKLQYRIAMLKKNVAAEESMVREARVSCAQSPLALLQDIFRQAISIAFPEALNDGGVQVSLTASTNENFGDYQCSASMPLSQYYKRVGQKLSPQEIARRILEYLPPNDIIAETSIAGPGFINITLNQSFVTSQLIQLLQKGVRAPFVARKKRVVVDFSSPNIAKQMHVGHLRSTIIGESICRLLEFVGHDVLRLNHIGDWGTQFGMLIAHLMDKFPDYNKNVPPIHDLQEFYKESKIRFDNDEEFKKRAYQSVVLLQSKNTDMIKAWELICDVSRKELEKIYRKLDVNLIERGESFYHDFMNEVIADLEKRNLLIEDDGRKLLFPTNKQLIPLTMVKSDGGYTYDTSDMACIKHRIEVEKADWIIYVVDGGQRMHFQTLFDCAKLVGYAPNHVRLDHVAFGLVLGEDRKKFKTRSGDTVKLNDLLDEGCERCLEKLKLKGRDKELTPEELKKAQEAVAFGCIKFADLTNSRQNDYVFSFDRMLDDRGKTAAYLLYSLTRIRSIARTAGVNTTALRETADKHVLLEHPKEIKLSKHLLRFPEIISAMLEELYIHPLCDYLFDLSSIFSEFYDNCYCIEKDKVNGTIKKINMGRLALCEATAQVMEKGFGILGIRTVDRM